MRCKGCPYEDYDYQENYPTCRLFGDDDEYIYENAKGELGCRFNQRGLQKFIRQHEEDEKVIVQQMGDFARWYQEQEKMSKVNYRTHLDKNAIAEIGEEAFRKLVSKYDGKEIQDL